MLRECWRVEMCLRYGRCAGGVIEMCLRCEGV